MEDFWKRVRNLLTDDLNQTWLAKEIGVSPCTLSNWIARGSDLKASRVQAIAQALGVTMEYLMTGQNPYLDEEPP